MLLQSTACSVVASSVSVYSLFSVSIVAQFFSSQKRTQQRLLYELIRNKKEHVNKHRWFVHVLLCLSM